MKKRNRILVVDDSLTTRGFIASLLTEHGFEINTAENGLRALELLSGQSYDCMILDLLMPEMDGFELLKELKKKRNSIPVIILTADIQEEVKEECYSLGAKDFLNKPITDPAVLLTSVNDQLKSRT